MMEVTQQVIADFRSDYPEFTDTAKYSDSLVIQYMVEGDNETGSRWGKYDDRPMSIKRRGMFAFAAHMITMRMAATTVTGMGGVANTVAQVASKSVGDESVSYANATADYATSVRDGSLPNTFYGQEFMRLRSRIVGPMWVC